MPSTWAQDGRTRIHYCHACYSGHAATDKYTSGYEARTPKRDTKRLICIRAGMN